MGIIADNLTGACDTGVQFAKQGFSTLVWLNLESLEDVPAELTVVTTNSRSNLSAEARQKVREVCQRFARNQTMVFYKKIDSTLQGNLGVEIDTVLKTCGFPFAIITPAFPAQGRCLIDGWLRISGAPQGEAVHLPTLLRKQSVCCVTHLDQRCLRNGWIALLDKLRRTHAAGAEFVVIDAASEGDLALIAHAAMEFKPCPLMVGSAGLAAQAAIILAQARQNDDDRSLGSDRGITDNDSIIIFVGSDNPVTTTQVKRLKDTRAAAEVQLGEGIAGAARNALREKLHLIVSIQWKGDEEWYLFHELLPLFEEYAIRGLVLTGGDTASVVFDAMGAIGIRLEDEILTGIPWGCLIGGNADRLAVCTKAGGFGDENALVNAVDFLTRQRPKLARFI